MQVEMLRLPVPRVLGFIDPYGVRLHNFDKASAAFSRTRFCLHSAVSNWARNGILRSRRALARVQLWEDCLRSKTVNAAAKTC
jgi:hypothetical protein